MTSTNSKSSSSNSSGSGKLRHDGPLPKHLRAEAARIAREYRFQVEHEGGEYFMRSVELPGVVGRAKTLADCEAKANESLIVTLGTMMAVGITPPVPFKDRRCQLNLRLSRAQRAAIEAAARQAGARDISTFARDVLLRAANCK